MTAGAAQHLRLGVNIDHVATVRQARYAKNAAFTSLKSTQEVVSEMRGLVKQKKLFKKLKILYKKPYSRHCCLLFQALPSQIL